ncbi:DUF1559 family PulG-like putative transporter [Allorhodopirellula heiligendammensis]|uniref:DUF1559 domain-containing protein n=1 Tax=Allorhodopirellula heiligendammensis TaxID=2714739 RepID=A0A5C6C3B0_9BACT|nr:DUF1559 domain-containing protein [Allorhodopirellula heiligendammensis]TWU19050.1 hypothetical protein Poly21_12210 [Allorhodopirellula heiligendammensis]|tara:strand:+ start:160 stop:1071 length:912 start_codon:yes stop_codon:yes gene_type:complete
MPYLFTCPHCDTRTEVDDAFSGQSGECVVCGHEITLPNFAPGARANGPHVQRPARTRRKRSVAWVAVAVVMLLIVGAAGIAIVRVGGTTAAKLRTGRTRMGSMKNLEKIAQALNAYAADHGIYPAPAILDHAGNPLLSWRVAILPYLGEEELYDQFDLGASWDSAQNQQISYRGMPTIYRHPDTNSWATETVYHLVTGAGTLFPSSGPLGPKQVIDGATQTILLVESSAPSIWTEPADLDFARSAGAINSSSGTDLGGVTDGGACVVTVDGRSHFLPETTAPMTVNALITPQGGEPLPDDVLD